MKVFKWNVGLKGVALGAIGLIAATLVGKAATMEIEDSVTKLKPEDKENEEKTQENSEENDSEGEANNFTEVNDEEK